MWLEINGIVFQLGIKIATNISALASAPPCINLNLQAKSIMNIVSNTDKVLHHKDAFSLLSPIKTSSGLTSPYYIAPPMMPTKDIKYQKLTTMSILLPAKISFKLGRPMIAVDAYATTAEAVR